MIGTRRSANRWTSTSAGLALFAVALVVTRPAPLAAQDASTATTAAPSDDARARALPIFQRGVGLVAAERWSEALEVFLEARAIFDSPILAFNIGVVQRALGQYVASLETLRAFLGSPLEGVAATRRADAEGLVAELEARIGVLAVVVPDELAAGAEVSIDGRAVALVAGRAELVVDPGPHTVQVRHEGHTPLFIDRRVGNGARVEIVAAMERLPARLVITANVQDARVRLDGEAIGVVPYDAEVDPGRRELVVEADGHVPHRATLELDPGVTATVAAELAPRGAEIYEEWWFWTLIGGVVAGASVGTYFAVRAEPLPPPYEGGSIGWVVGGSM